MLKFTHFSLRRGIKELLRDVDMTLHAGQKIGITGANGVGKSSLFSLILGDLQADTGNFFIPSNTVIAHVAQETLASEKAAIEYVIDGDISLRRLESQISVAELENNSDLLSQLYSQLDDLDGYSANSRAGRLMHGLGFSAEQERNHVNEFSGGWRMRLNLAQALMCPSDLLLLDEPTNHLDMDAVIWLEDWLRVYPGTLLLISHDRDFLDRVTSHIAHIEQQSLTLYTGNYSAFEVRRAEHLANQQANYEKQQTEIAHAKSYIERFRAKATKARQAQSRIKALERMEIISQAHVDSPFHFEFFKCERMPNQLLHLDEVNAGYGNTVVLSNIQFEIIQGDRIGLLGHNGAGKSTLIKLLADELTPMVGKRTIAKNINIGYFAQHQLEQLDSTASPLLHLQRLNAKASEKELRSFLGGFGFRDDMALSTVAPFSGGEKARLVLAMIVYQKPDLLLLDEPTNHLDIEMRHAISLALQDFEGAVILVSHDRHLLRTVSDRLFLVADAKVSEFNGDLDDYRRWLKDHDKVTKAKCETESQSTTGAVIQSSSLNKKELRQARAKTRERTQPLTNRIKKLESQLDEVTMKQKKIHDQLADSCLYEDENKKQLKQLLLDQAELGKQHNDIEELWLIANEELENLQQT